MNIALIFKVAGIGVLITVINMIFETSGKKEWNTYTTITGVIIVLALVMTEISGLFNAVRTMFQLY
ncbi:MAG: stage III sporulation protein AC [Peptostreptococcaceae bacterium]|jgi:stage III sporulation protein AC|nr:stage III sporulation protein AC [Peptostreptococcaceae bacterium]MBP3931534.1 stage III sporulation protein AC [Peptostreptococcaceae bacterium]